MAASEFSHLELLAEIDTISGRLRHWSESAGEWQAAQPCRAIVRRLLERTEALRIRVESPLVVATLGGTGVGKSTLVNALVGSPVAATGRARPTTLRPVLVSRPGITPEMLGIDPKTVEHVSRDASSLSDLALVDCPDPDTTEDPASPGTNLARLRPILAHCDVVLVVTTQQKYRSARVTDELAAAAPGARLVFVQTHADLEADIRDDWRRVLQSSYAPGDVFFVDSERALADAQSGRPAEGEFARLQELLSRELAGAAAHRIRRANFVDLAAEALDAMAERLEAAMPAVAKLRESVDQQREKLAAHLARQTREELAANRRAWEGRLLDRVIGRWGFSPFSLVLRTIAGLGNLVSRAGMLRARTPAQLALWGAFEAARNIRAFTGRIKADRSLARAAAGSWDAAELKSASLVLTGYAADAGMAAPHENAELLAEEAALAAGQFAEDVAAGLDQVINRQAARHSGWFVRFRYECLLAVMLGILLFRLGKNFFYDSWLAPHPVPVFGMSFYLAAGFWLAVWCLALYWAFVSRLRDGLRGQLNRMAEAWAGARPAAALFESLERQCRQAETARSDLEQLRLHVVGLRGRLALSDEPLGHRKSPSRPTA